MHARFLAEQEARGMSESELLRLALHQLFESGEKPPVQPQVTGAGKPHLAMPASEEANLERKTVWMPAFLMKAAAERARGKGMSFSRWASSLVQSNLMRPPVLTERELLTIEASTRELGAIGRNIGQIARSLDETYFRTERIRLDRLAELSAKITATRTAIGALVRASRRSWRAD